eukprot:1393055-Amorphochlora_amoeboformis.AAC.1
MYLHTCHIDKIEPKKRGQCVCMVRRNSKAVPCKWSFGFAVPCKWSFGFGLAAQNVDLFIILRRLVLVLFVGLGIL